MFSKITVGQGTIHLSRVVAIILAFMAFGMFMFFAVTFILLPLFGQINDLVAKLPDYTTKVESTNMDWLLKDPSQYPRLPYNFETLIDDAMTWVMGFMGGILRNLFKSTMDIIANLVGLIVVPFLAFYFLKDWRELRLMMINLFTYDTQPKVAHILDEIGRTLSAYIQGLGKLSLIAGACITVGVAILGIQFPLVFGFLAVMAETVPVVGPLMGAVPAVFIAYSQNTSSAFSVALFYLVFYQIDGNILMPRIMGSKIDLHPVVLILSLLIGAKLYGILGMLFAVPVAAVYRVLYKELWHSSDEPRPTVKTMMISDYRLEQNLPYDLTRPVAEMAAFFDILPQSDSTDVLKIVQEADGCVAILQTEDGTRRVSRPFTILQDVRKKK